MTKLLDTVDASLQEVEEQLLAEFSRIRNTISEARFEPIDVGIQTSLSSVVQELWHMLEHSGDKNDLQLQSEQQEALFARASVIKQLLKTKIPTAYLHEVHKDVKSSRKILESKVVEKRQIQKEQTPKEDPKDSPAKKSGFFGSIKGMFSRNQSEQESLRNRIKVTDQEAKEFEPVEMYLDSGIYSASRELAMLSSRIFDRSHAEKQAEPAKKKVALPSGKASFESRDLSQRAPPPVQEDNKIAQTPEEIRRKLENKQSKPNSASTFESRELTQTISPTDGVDAVKDNAGFKNRVKEKLAENATPSEGKAIFGEVGKSEIAQSPEAIRKKLAARQQPTVTGKATFGSKDIDHAMPAVDKTRPPVEASPEPAPPSKGKAIFESKDLSKPGPIRKK